MRIKKIIMLKISSSLLISYDFAFKQGEEEIYFV